MALDFFLRRRRIVLTPSVLAFPVCLLNPLPQPDFRSFFQIFVLYPELTKGLGLYSRKHKALEAQKPCFWVESSSPKKVSAAHQI
jgi:hypothetical protein